MSQATPYILACYGQTKCMTMVSLLACHAEDRGSFLPGERKQRHERLN